MLRFNIEKLRKKRQRETKTVVSYKDIELATGIKANLLRSLARKPNRHANRPLSTNTRFIDALCRYFNCTVGELVELAGSTRITQVEALYPPKKVGRPLQTLT